MRGPHLALAFVLVASCSDDPDPGGTTTATGSGSGVAGAAGAGGGGSGGGEMGGAGEGGDSGGSGGAGGGGGAGAGATGGGGGGLPTGPSCASLPATCGPNEDEGCCASATVVGGTYLRSYDGVSFLDNGNPATVSTFALDRFEVTVGRFRAFVDDGGGVQTSPPTDGDGAHPAVANSGWSSLWNGELENDTTALRLALSCSAAIPVWTSTAGPNETLPINCVTWYEAAAFCAWDGGRLPTEAEWNYAAAGGDQQRAYPWSSPPSSTTIDATYAVYDCTADGSAAGVCALSDVQAVGSRSPLGDCRWGHADLGGNMWEWALDFSNSSYVNPCVDCADLSQDNSRRIRGGSYFNPALGLRTASRADNGSDYRAQHVGLRCARNP